jgi:hypothetical protein
MSQTLKFHGMIIIRGTRHCEPVTPSVAWGEQGGAIQGLKSWIYKHYIILLVLL